MSETKTPSRPEMEAAIRAACLMVGWCDPDDVFFEPDLTDVLGALARLEGRNFAVTANGSVLTWDVDEAISNCYPVCLWHLPSPLSDQEDATVAAIYGIIGTKESNG